SANPSLIATVPSVAVHALGTRATGPPGHASWWCRAPPEHSVHPARAGRGGIACGGPAHRPPSPNRAAPEPPTCRAFPDIARDACDMTRPRVRGIPRVVAHPAPTLQEGTTGSRARRDRGERRTPCRLPPGSCRPSLGGHTTGAPPPTIGCLVR